MAIEPYSYGDGIGNYGGETQPTARKYTIVQSLWTKPIMQGDDHKEAVKHMKSTLVLCALSLAYAHRSGYKVNMHTDTYGKTLLKDYGYDKLLTTLDDIPETVPTELFAAGKFFAMRAEGRVGFVHIDIDVFLKKAGVIDIFYKNKSIDLLCQMEEDYDMWCFHSDKIRAMKALGYPAATYPEWHGSINTGTIGFNNPALAAEYINNYFEALKMYTKEKFEAYKATDEKACLWLDFILEQVNLSFMSRGYNVKKLVPMHAYNEVADDIGYQHLQGGNKWGDERQSKLKTILYRLDSNLFMKMQHARNLVK